MTTTSSQSRHGAGPRSPLRAALTVLAVGSLALLTGCGTLDARQPGANGPGSTTSGPTQRPGALLITHAALPSGQGWRDSNSQGVDYRLTVCGVDLEPVAPRAATSVRFSRGAVGPFLEQHVRVYERDETSAVITALQAALPTCTEYSAKGTRPDSPTATFTVEPLTVKGAGPDTVAWRQTSQGDLPITSDILITRRGNATVTLMSYALRGEPDTAVLSSALAALPKGA